MVEIRLTAQERRQAILEAAMKVFAERGFAGTTTKEIAQKAGVSEALLYRHFPSKDELHFALQDQLCSHKENVLNYFKAKEPSTAMLVQLHYIFLNFIARPGEEDSSLCVSRLLMQNVLDDGKFAREFHEERMYVLFPFYKQCLKRAIAAGDIRDTGMNEMECFWFMHHIAVMIALNSMPETPVFEYRKNIHSLLKDVLSYSLRGIGMSEQAIQTHVDTDKLDLGLQQVMQHASTPPMGR